MVLRPWGAAAVNSGFGATRDAFVTFLHGEELGRLPEPDGLRFWSGRMAAGVKPQAVACAISHSSEHRDFAAQPALAGPMALTVNTRGPLLRAWRGPLAL